MFSRIFCTYVSKHALRAWSISHSGSLAKPKLSHLKSVDNPIVISSWLALLKSAFLREERYTSALKCTDLALTFLSDDTYEIRNRGFIYQNQVNAMSLTQVTVH